MKKIANHLTAYFYFFVMKIAVKKSKEELLKGESINAFGQRLVLSSLTYLMLMLIVFIILIMIISQIIKYFFL